MSREAKSWRLISQFMRWFCVDYHNLKLLPIDLLICLALSFFFSCLFVLQEKYTNEEV